MRKTRHNYTPLIEYKLFPDKLDSGPREKGMHKRRERGNIARQ
jgi:hypothetical protein